MRLVWSILAVLAVTGVHSLEIPEEVITSVRNLKKGENRYGIYKFDENFKPAIEYTGPRSATYADFLEDLTRSNPAEPRYGLIDYKIKPPAELLLVLWVPETAEEDKRTAYAAVYDREIAAQYGLNHFIIAETLADLDKKTVLSKLNENPVTTTPKSEEKTIGILQ